ncbi:hypothetical protein, variant [Saprolegnia diclina VS20]|nr:hypothetical protein, variant [Saprolegnia diclina VS20]EQC30424.1 hypothetical protein, variant [Saprolegnia diclina VS20]|eukprot:XP_008616277.1 hypothetical protein, variant [Saprolegnia diclina VS20]
MEEDDADEYEEAVDGEEEAVDDGEGGESDVEENENDDDNDEEDDDDDEAAQEVAPTYPRRSRRHSHNPTDEDDDVVVIETNRRTTHDRAEHRAARRSSHRSSLADDSEVDAAFAAEESRRARRARRDEVMDVDEAPAATSRSTRRNRRAVHEDDAVDENEDEDEDHGHRLERSSRRRTRRSNDVHDDEDEDEETPPTTKAYTFRNRSQRHFRYTPDEPVKRLKREPVVDDGNQSSESTRQTQAMDRARRYALRQQQHHEDGFLEQAATGALHKPSRRRPKRIRELLDEVESLHAGSDSPPPLNLSAGYSLRNRNTIRRTVSTYETLAAAETRPSSKTSSNPYSDYLSRRSKKEYEPPRHRRQRKPAGSSSDDDDEDRIVKRHKREVHAILPLNDTSGKNGQLRADVAPIEIDKSVNWDSVGGLHSHINALKEMVLLPMLYPEFYTKYGVTPPSGVLFYGPPGTGKTLMARALANSCTDQHITFYMRKGADCLSKWVGEAERQLRLLFEQAKRTQPSIIFFDEIDGLAPVRSAKQDQIHASIVSTLLALMDGLDGRGRVIVIGATNRLDAIDPALRRPGRFDRELGFTLPNVEDRAAMLQIHTKCWQPPLAPTFRMELAKQLHGYCGADIKALCAETALVALHRTYPQVYASTAKLAIDASSIQISRADFHVAFRKVKPASHRSHQTLAQPLPTMLAPLLEDALEALVEKIAAAFPIATQSFDRSATPAAHAGASSGPSIFLAEHHDASCHACGLDVGDAPALRCETCPRSLHAACAPMSGIVCSGCAMSALVVLPAQFASAQATRVLVHGADGMGQSPLLAALLHRFERLLVFSLDLPSLLSDINHHNLEEAMLGQLKEAKKSTPSIVVLPNVDVWWHHTSVTAHALLEMFLRDCQHLPLLLLATSSTPSASLPAELQRLFGAASTVAVAAEPPSTASRRRLFQAVFAAFTRPPVKALKAPAPIPLLAPVVAPIKEDVIVVDDGLTLRHEQEAHHLRELRIFLGMVIDYCMEQKKNAPFLYPVDPDDVPSYYSVITRPMDLSFMREKVNDGEYDTYESFLKDIQLIVRNANEFNPRGCPTRYVAHAAAAMQDNVMSFGHRFRQQQGYDLFAKCREISKLREKEAGKPRKRRFAPARKSQRIMEDGDEGGENEATNEATVDEPTPEQPDATPEAYASFEVGDKVFVERRTMPGMNKLGGAGIVTDVHMSTDDDDDVPYYSVKYVVLGGLEKRIHPKYLRLLTDDVLKDSFEIKRSDPSLSTSSAKHPAQPSTASLEKHHFDTVLWPTLYQEGWERVPWADPTSEKPKWILVSTVPPSAPDVWTKDFMDSVQKDLVWFTSRKAALAYIKSDAELSAKCFGQRFLDENATTPVSPRHASKARLEDEQRQVAETFRMAQEDKPAVEAIVVETLVDDEASCDPPFVCDEVAMSEMLNMMVDKTDGWSVDTLVAEVHALHLLGAAHEAAFDRTALLEAVTTRVAAH